jgi:hypothetical protein
MKLREAEHVGQTVGAPCAPQLGIASVDISTSTSSAAQRQRSTASSGPTTLSSPRQADNFFYSFFSLSIVEAALKIEFFRCCPTLGLGEGYHRQPELALVFASFRALCPQRVLLTVHIRAVASLCP